LLHLIAERPNLCNAVHIPAQSGNSDVLHNMRRFYTREAYVELIQRMREVIPSTFRSSTHKHARTRLQTV
jgi:tRNA A37 methylthiotransferase MiaB